jgi:recombination protein RecA
MSIEMVMKKYRQFIGGETEHIKFQFGPLNLTKAISGNYDGVLSGKIYQIVGLESSGKTTLAVDIAASFQKQHNQQVLWVDFERSVSNDYFRSCGLDMSQVIHFRPDYAEDGLNAVQDFIEAGVQMVVIDSVAFALPKAHAQKSFGETMKIAATASLMTEFCKRMVPLIDNKDATIILINQLRKNMNPMSHEEYTPFGGMAIRQAVNVTVFLSVIKREENIQHVQAVVQKNKQGSPRVRVEFPIVYGIGVDHRRVILDMAKDRNIVKLNGSWYYYNDIKVQGLESALAAFPLENIKQEIITYDERN